MSCKYGVNHCVGAFPKATDPISNRDITCPRCQADRDGGEGKGVLPPKMAKSPAQESPAKSCKHGVANCIGASWRTVTPSSGKLVICKQCQGDRDGYVWKGEKPGAAVQHAYVNARVHEINSRSGSLREQTKAVIKKKHGHKMTGKDGDHKEKSLEKAYVDLTQYLRECDLTINFKALSWFSGPNNFESYIQMYEKGMGGGKMILSDSSDPSNPPLVRGPADDYMSIPQNWPNQKTAAPTSRMGKGGGLTPSFKPGTDRISGRMMVGNGLISQSQVEAVGNLGIQGFADEKLIPSDYLKAGEKEGTYEAGNSLFNPKTKQIFAALNYGRRRHGSTHFYGWSHFVLKPQLKTNAIYYPCDTFFISCGAESQTTYQELGSIYLQASKTGCFLDRDLDACFFNGTKGTRLPDCDSGFNLIEAHIFEKVTFHDALELHLSAKDWFGLDGFDSAPIQRNAKAFCEKWKIKYVYEAFK